MYEKIRIYTLGEFSIKYRNVTVSDQDNRSKKIWVLLEYLITFHNKEISSSTLIDLLWPEGTSNVDPANALKTLLHRTRKILEKLGYEHGKLIIRRRDTFAWNNDIPFEIDVDVFERYYNLGSLANTPDKDRLSYFIKAFQLYKGDYLPKSAGEAWAVPIVTYYHSIYIKMIHEMIQILKSESRNEEIIHYCSFAATIDPYDEYIHYHLILSLYETGKPKAALEQYDLYLSMLYNNFGVKPSKELSALYKEIIKQKKNPEMDLNVIEEDLVEQNAKPLAYFCDYAIFQNLYQIEARSIARSGLSIFLCLITMEGKDPSNTQLLSKAMSKMSEVIASCLRSGDVFSRYSANQYIVMLPTASHENCIQIGTRILRTYDEMKPTINHVIASYHLKHMNPQTFQ